MALNASARSSSSRGGAALDVEPPAGHERVDLVHQPREVLERPERAPHEHEVRAERDGQAREEHEQLAGVHRGADGRRAERERERRDEHHDGVEQRRRATRARRAGRAGAAAAGARSTGGSRRSRDKDARTRAPRGPAAPRSRPGVSAVTRDARKRGSTTHGRRGAALSSSVSPRVEVPHAPVQAKAAAGAHTVPPVQPARVGGGRVAVPDVRLGPPRRVSGPTPPPSARRTGARAPARAAAAGTAPPDRGRRRSSRGPR